MEDFQKRMLVEFKDLDEKWKKLYDFVMNNPLFEKLDKQERIYQVHQYIGMDMYRTALIGRLVHQGLMKEIDAVNDKSTERLKIATIMKSELARNNTTERLNTYPLATELADKLDTAVSMYGNKPVVNSISHPALAGAQIKNVLYNRNDDLFELE